MQKRYKNGRPIQSREKLLTETISVRIRKDTYDILEKKAKNMDVYISEYIRSVLEDHACDKEI